MPREANSRITWEVSTTDIGFDLNIWNSLLTMEFDYFHENRTGMLLAPQATLPVEYGLSLSEENKGRMNSDGIEINVGTRKLVSKDLDFSLNTNVSYSINRMQEVFQTDARAKNPNRTRVGEGNSGHLWLQINGFVPGPPTIRTATGVIDAADGYNVTQFGALRGRHPLCGSERARW